MNFFTSMQQNINNWETFTTSHHNIDTVVLGMETLEKTQDGKTGAAVRYRFYYEKIWIFYNHWKFTQTWRMQYPAESLGKSQLNLNTLLCECTAQLYEARWSCCSLLRLLSEILCLTFSPCLYPVSVEIQVCVSSPPIDLSFITLGKAETLISLSL